MDGRLYYYQEQESESGVYESQISLKGIPKGLAILTVKSEEETISRKVILR